MSRPGRIPKLGDNSYVLTAGEVARLYFRRGPNYINDPTFLKLHPTFPQPRKDGLFHRASVEAWVDSTFGIVSNQGGTQQNREAALMEIARRGARQNAARPPA